MTQRPVRTALADAPTLGVQIVDRADGAWVILRGEADMATLEDLEAALVRVEQTDPRRVHLDVTELTFADVASIRALAVFAHRARRSGCCVRTCGVSPMLRKVAHIVGFHTALGIL